MDPLAFLLAHQATRDGIHGAGPNDGPQQRGRRRPETAPGASARRARKRGRVAAGGRRASALRALVQRP